MVTESIEQLHLERSWAGNSELLGAVRADRVDAGARMVPNRAGGRHGGKRRLGRETGRFNELAD